MRSAAMSSNSRCSPIPQKLLSLGLSFADVIKALERNNSGIGAGYIERSGESYVVRANGAAGERPKTSATWCSPPSNGVPVYLKDVAEVGIGRELRTGSASEDGGEVVVGTVMMLKGGNSRTVAGAADEKMKVVNAIPPTRISS